ncbi:MAG: RluA family pseudouridine synthase, partial [Caldilineae bacterium]
MDGKTLTLVCQTENQRLDRFLAEALPDVSRGEVQRWIAEGRVHAPGRKMKPSTRLPLGAEVTVTLPAPEAALPAAQPIPLDILFEDEAILVLNKPAGQVVHPAAGHAQDTLVNALLHHCPALAALHPERPGIVHRLDRDTSGVMVVAKTKEALRHLQGQFKARKVEKVYRALVYGVPASPVGIIDVPLGRDPRHRQRFAPLPDGKPARTRYRVVETFAGYSLLDVQPETGRTHQIRVHLAWLGHPVAGDALYGRRRTPLPLRRQFLHAARLRFDHPLT